MDVRLLDLNHKPTDYTRFGKDELLDAYEAQNAPKRFYPHGRIQTVETNLTPFCPHWAGLVFNDKQSGMML